MSASDRDAGSQNAGGAACPQDAPPNCPLCTRLVSYRAANRAAEPHWYNGAVPSFGDTGARLAIVGLAPGRTGANRTGRPFTGDYAGVLLYQTLIEFGFATGRYGAEPDDGLRLRDCLITNAVRCAPPENKPLPSEIATCRPFLTARLASLQRLQIIVALGRVAHEQTLAALALRKAAFPFVHGRRHELSPAPGLVLYDSYHCSRYNTNTGRLTGDMFREVFAAVRSSLDGAL